jgi:hypothetical protein
MEQTKKDHFGRIFSVLLILVGIAGILASFQKYYQIKDGTAEWNSKYAEPWFYSNPDGFLIYIIIEAIALLCITGYAIAHLVTRKDKYWETAMGLYIITRLANIVNEFIKG